MIMLQTGHARYAHFLEYGDAENFHSKHEIFRGELADKKDYDANR
jgi:hypothetical protein